MWLHHLTASVAFCDVETTGLGKHDRIVSFGGIGMISRNLMKGSGDLKYVYLVFDPGVGNRGGAARIHGFLHSTLRLQDPFAVHAADLRRFLMSYDLLVAHNTAFDLRFINREMRLAGLPALTRPVYCTMKGYRALGRGGSASLSAVCRHIKLARAGRRLARDANLSLAPRAPTPAAIARLASSRSIKLTSPWNRLSWRPTRGRTAPGCPVSKAIAFETYCRFTAMPPLPWTAAEPREEFIQ